MCYGTECLLLFNTSIFEYYHPHPYLAGNHWIVIIKSSMIAFVFGEVSMFSLKIDTLMYVYSKQCLIWMILSRKSGYDCGQIFHIFTISCFYFRLDYCGISVLTVGSFVPWLYYCFYCRLVPKICYLALIFTLGSCCTVVSLMDKFQTPKFRPVRAGEWLSM